MKNTTFGKSGTHPVEQTGQLSASYDSLKDHSRFNYKEVFRLLADYQIPGVHCEIASSADQASVLATQIGFPVALKVDVEQFSHKSDVGGVVLNLNSGAEIVAAYEKIRSNLRDYGLNTDALQMAVQKMAMPGTEIIIGMKRDPQFGPVIMAGMGGVLTEILNDIAFRIAPVTRPDVEEMLAEIKGSRILNGYRDREPVDTEALISCVLNLSRLATENDNIVEIDLNPVILYPRGKGLCVVDARMLFEHTS